MKEQSKKRRVPAVLVIALVAIIVIVGVTTAWFRTGDTPVTRTFSLANFDASVAVYFKNGNTVTVAANNIEQYRASDGAISVSFNSTAPNYIGYLHADVTMTGAGVYMLRVQCTQHVTDANGNPVAFATLPYTINRSYEMDKPDTAQGEGHYIRNQQAWFDNRGADHCIYYATPATTPEKSPATDPVTYENTVALITGTDMSKLDTALLGDLTASVAFEAQAVQVERFPQFWYDYPAKNGSITAAQADALLPWQEPDHAAEPLLFQ